MTGRLPRPVVYFLSDYGLQDEFVGVVHAVLLRLVPDVAVVDLTHGIPAFDIRAAAESLARAVPHLGPGVVLGVVDPGVGSARRAVAVRAAGGRWFVAPDNGLVVPALEASGGVEAVLELRKPEDAPATFDGRDVFAPAAAALAAMAGTAAVGDAVGAVGGAVGDEVDPASLVRLPPLEVTTRQEGGRRVLRAPVVWVDKFGNAQLGAPLTTGPPPWADGVTVRVDGVDLAARRVRAFADLAHGELGVLVDANGRLAVVVNEGSAAERAQLASGTAVELLW